MCDPWGECEEKKTNTFALLGSMIPNPFQILFLLPQELKTLSVRSEQWNFLYRYGRHDVSELLSSCISLTPVAQAPGSTKDWKAVTAISKCCLWLSSESFPVICVSNVLRIKYLGIGMSEVERVCHVWTFLQSFPWIEEAQLFLNSHVLVWDRADRCGCNYSTSNKYI